jgi:hypothetical protein
LLVKEGDETVKTAMENLTENANANMPVGTTLALIEQGMKVLSAIHMRMHHAMDQVIKILHRINRMYVTDAEIKNDTGEVMAFRKDFQGPMDVIPVSDPQIFSDVQRFAQIQMVAQRAQGNPLYDQRKVEELILERTKIPNAKELLIAEPKAQELNAVNENVAASLGRPIAAFPEQDHLAHIQTHLDFLTSPFFGYLAVIAPNFVPAILSHLREHIVLWYVNEAYDMVNAQLEGQMSFDQVIKEKDPMVQKELDRLLAQISPKLIENGQAQFAKLPPIIEQAMGIAKQYAPTPQDPAQAVAKIQQETEVQKSAARSKDVQTKEQSTTQRESVKQQATNEREKQKAISATQIAQFKEQHSDARNQTDNQIRERMNQQDNLTAMTIAGAELESAENTDMSTGHGINPE